MLDSLDYKLADDGLKIGVFGKDAPKADGHNNLSGDSSLPTRQFIPGEGDSFRPDIRKGIESIIAEYVAEESIPVDELRLVESKSELFDILRSTFQGLSTSEITTAVLNSDEWYDTLQSLGLLKWLQR